MGELGEALEGAFSEALGAVAQPQGGAWRCITAWTRHLYPQN